MISVIIPVYNVEKYLEKCIRSILSNTYHDLEIICVNDGSPDGCLEKLKQLQREDPRIVIIDQKNQGVQTARNNGIKKASGEFIAFVDSDDFIHPRYFESLLNCMEAKNADVVICGCQKVSEDEEIPTEEYSHIRYRKLSAYQLYSSYYGRRMVWGRLFRTKDVKDIWFSPTVRTYDDTLYNLSFIANLENPVVYETNIPLYYYLQREGSIVKTSTYEKMADFADWYVNQDRNSEKDGPWSWIRLMQAIKLTLSYRYAAILRDSIERETHANRLLRQMQSEMISSRQIHHMDKVIHIVMIRFPALYRFFRLKNDPTMKIWEQNVRERQKTNS